MSFWNNLKTSINGAADYTVKKTGEITGTTKIRMDIRAKNTALAKCYENIGRAYYRREKGLGENHEETIAAAITEADTLKEEIAALRQEMAKLQGCVICPACSAQISDQSIFCPLCGVKLPEKPAKEEHTETEAESCGDAEECACTEEYACEECGGESADEAETAEAADEPKESEE